MTTDDLIDALLSTPEGLGLVGGSFLFLLLMLLLFWLSRKGNGVSQGTYGRGQRLWRRLAFWGGDVCYMRHFPWITWDKHGYDVSPEELLEGLKVVKAGYIGLATKKGYFISNMAIPGLFKHAFIFVNSPYECTHGIDVGAMRIVEAVSEGVQEWHPLNARADYMVFLRPRVGDEQRLKAASVAKKMVGCDYDAGFNFDIEEELKHFKDTNILPKDKLVGEEQELKTHVENLKSSYDMAFSCTEVVAAAWWHCRNELHVFREKSRGRSVIVADQFMNMSFEVVWTNVTPEVADRCGLHEEGLEMIQTYWNKKKKGGGHVGG